MCNKPLQRDVFHRVWELKSEYNTRVTQLTYINNSTQES